MHIHIISLSYLTDPPIVYLSWNSLPSFYHLLSLFHPQTSPLLLILGLYLIYLISYLIDPLSYPFPSFPSLQLLTSFSYHFFTSVSCPLCVFFVLSLYLAIMSLSHSSLTLRRVLSLQHITSISSPFSTFIASTFCTFFFLILGLYLHIYFPLLPH